VVVLFLVGSGGGRALPGEQQQWSCSSWWAAAVVVLFLMGSGGGHALSASTAGNI
jgi:hypothetical protein